MKKIGLFFISIIFLIVFILPQLTPQNNPFSIYDVKSLDYPMKIDLIYPSNREKTSKNITFHYNVTGDSKIKSVSLFFDGAESQVLNYLNKYFNDSTLEFSEKLRQKVSSVIPLVINYNEIQGRNEKTASPQLLSGVLLYKITGNVTYLHYAKETAEWLNQGDNREFLLFWYNVSSGSRASISTNGFEAHLYALIALVEQDNRFLPLANWALNEFHRIFVPATNLSYVLVRSDETPEVYFADLGNQAYRIALFSYAYAITKNVTYKQWAKDLTLAFWEKRSAINITPAYLNQDGSVLYDYVKEDQHAGFFLLGLETAYYYTKDHCYREIIESYAQAVSTYFWHS